MMAKLYGGDEDINPGFDVMAEEVAPNVLAWEPSPGKIADAADRRGRGWPSGNGRVQAVMDQGAPSTSSIRRKVRWRPWWPAAWWRACPQPKLRSRSFVESSSRPRPRPPLANVRRLGTREPQLEDRTGCRREVGVRTRQGERAHRALRVSTPSAPSGRRARPARTSADRTHAVAFLELQGLAKRYGDAPPAVAEVSLTVAPGEFVGLLGPSGCGKTTTLRMMAGLAEASAGRVLLDGRISRRCRRASGAWASCSRTTRCFRT